MRVPLPVEDYIDRSAGIPVRNQSEERQIFFDEPPQPVGGIPLSSGITYEESADAAQLYAPLTGTVKSQAFSGTRIFPAFMNPASTAPVAAADPKQASLSAFSQMRKSAGRFHPAPEQPSLRSQPDPIDIDDDVSDHGAESVATQLRELDGMNKYLQKVRVPTSKPFNCSYLYFDIELANDDYLNLNGVRNNAT
jgi:hypothetical protein